MDTDAVRFRIGVRSIGGYDVEVVIEAEEDALSVHTRGIILRLSTEEARWLADNLHAACHVLGLVRPAPRAG